MARFFTTTTLFIIVCSLVCSTFVSGCIFQNISSGERLRDAVVGFNDEVRWNRFDLAVQRVLPEFRETFRLSHMRWGKEIRVADMDILHVETAGEKSEMAVSNVAIRWYDDRTMILADTVVSQQWKKVSGGYMLLQETVRSGNRALLEIPPEFQPPQEDLSENLSEDEGWNEPDDT